MSEEQIAWTKALEHKRMELIQALVRRDLTEADRLKAVIETSGWKIVDRGTDFALAPAAAPDIVEGRRVRYGSSASVPSRLEEEPGSDARWSHNLTGAHAE